MITNRRFAVLAAVTLALSSNVPAATTPTTMPADASALIEQIRSAYAGLKSLSTSGNISADLDVGGQTKKQQDVFTSSFAAPNLYRHQAGKDLLVGSTGQKTYAYEMSANRYLLSDAPAQRTSAKDIPSPIPQVLDMQNPSLLLAIADNSLTEMLDGAANVQKGDQQTVGTGKFDTLQFTSSDGRKITFLVDAGTHLLRQAKYDISPILQKRGATEVKKALVTIDFNDTKVNPAMNDSFAWNPPEGSREAKAGGETAASASALEGKAAPDFKLTGLDGKQVQLSTLTGNVVVLDFWATWCPPCVRSLPDLDKVVAARGDKALKAFAINLKEEKAAVQDFVKSKGLTINVLLDTEGATADAYKAEAIPQTVIIGKDGKVRKVWVGVPTGGEAEVAREIDAALMAK